MKQGASLAGLKAQAHEVARLNRGGDLENLGKLGDVVAALCDQLTEFANHLQALEARLKKLEESARKR